MASDVGIINSALIKIGEETIASTTEDTKAARVANQIYTQIRDAVLRAHPWNFALGRVALSQLVATPAFEWDYQYSLPSDCLRVLAMEDAQDFKIEARNLLTNESTAKILYVKKVIDPNLYDTLFIEALSARLAQEFAFVLAENVSLMDTMHALYNKKIKEARSVDGQESTPTDVTVDYWLGARY